MNNFYFKILSNFLGSLHLRTVRDIFLFLTEKWRKKSSCSEMPSTFCIRKPLFSKEKGGFSGASDLTRTGDLLITSEMHYRLCYTSVLMKLVNYTGIWGKCQSFFTAGCAVPAAWSGWRAGRRRFRGVWWGRGGERRGGRLRSSRCPGGWSRCRAPG